MLQIQKDVGETTLHMREANALKPSGLIDRLTLIQHLLIKYPFEPAAVSLSLAELVVGLCSDGANVNPCSRKTAEPVGTHWRCRRC